MNFGDPSAIGTEMADRFVVSGANLPPHPLYKIGLRGIELLFNSRELEMAAENVNLVVWAFNLKRKGLYIGSETKSSYSIHGRHYHLDPQVV